MGSLPSICLCPDHQHAHCCSSPVFYLWSVAGIKNFRSWRTWQGTDNPPTCRESHCASGAPLCSRKAAIHLCRCLEWSIRSCYQVICPLDTSVHSCSTATQRLLAGLLSLKKQYTLFKCISGRGLFSPSMTQGIPTPQPLGWTQHALFLTLFPDFSLWKGLPPSMAPQLFFPSIHDSKPCICHVLSFQLWRPFS